MLLFTAKIRLIMQTTKYPTKNFISGPDPNIKFFDRRDRPYLLTGPDPSRRFFGYKSNFFGVYKKNVLKTCKFHLNYVTLHMK